MRRRAGVLGSIAGLAVLAAAAGVLTAQEVPTREPWPDPGEMMNWGRATRILFNEVELAPTADSRPLILDTESWYGGQYQRVWLRAQGEASTRGGGGSGDAQLLYGRLIDPFFDAVIGVGVDRRWGDGQSATRAMLAAGLQGIAPYWFEVSPTVFLSQAGDLSGRIEARYQALITQRLIVEPKVELNAALQEVPRFGVGRGLNDVEFGLRARYEFKREIGPYVGYSWSRRYGGAAELARRAGEPVHERQFVLGLRVWR